MIYAVFGAMVGLIGGFGVALAVSELARGAPDSAVGLAACVFAGAIAGAIVGGTKDITEAIRDTRKLKTKL